MGSDGIGSSLEWRGTGCNIIVHSNLFSTTLTDVMPLKDGIHLRIAERYSVLSMF